MSTILTGTSSVKQPFCPGVSGAGSILNGPDFLFGFYPRFGSLKFGDPAGIVSTSYFYGTPIEFGSCQFGEYHGYLATSAMFYA